MKVAILGATGPTGLLVIQQLLDSGHSVTAYTRRVGTIPSHPQIKIVVGELDDAVAMKEAFRGADAIICCLGPKPGLKTMRSTQLMSQAFPGIVGCMRAAGVSRIVVLSAIGVGKSRPMTSPFARLLYKLAMSAIFDDKLRSEKILTSSGLDWTLVYAPILTNGPYTGALIRRDLDSIDRIPGLPKSSRADVAEVLVDAATSEFGSRRIIVLTP